MDGDSSTRLRNAVKENNLFLVKRLINKVDLRNPDPGPSRYTSLAWAAVCGHEETFEFLLSNGHDDVEITKDADNNTIIILLAGLKPHINDPYRSRPHELDLQGSALRMARLYYERYPFTLDWPNFSGKTALHIASIKGNEEFIKMLHDLGGDIDLPDLQGNTPLHYASAWGHLAVVQVLIERGCRFAMRNNEGFMAADYAYSTATSDILQDSARLQFENNRRQRQEARLAARQGQQNDSVSLLDLGATQSRPINGSSTVSPDRHINKHLISHPSISSSSLQVSNSIPVIADSKSLDDHSSQIGLMGDGRSGPVAIRSRIPPPTAQKALAVLGMEPPHPALTPVATRMREKDADAIAQYMDVLNRGRSGSQSQSAVVDAGGPGPAPPPKTTSHPAGMISARAAIHKLRQSVSAAQLRNDGAVLKSHQAGVPPELSSAARGGQLLGHGVSGQNNNTRRSPFAILSRGSSQGDFTPG